ncbi:MAG: hypothetical protein EOP51_18160 [Sphingobacteriales bacterium]|nr:MAG: hypothetical protein EOP51_18160 [Sphingobacteriales bacterium]
MTTTRTLLSIIAAAALSLSAMAQEKELHNSIHLGLVYPLSTNGIHAQNYSNTVSLHAIGGISSSEEALCASGLGNVILNDAKGLAAAGFFNYIGGNANGIVASGFFSSVKNDVEGLQVSGFGNISGSVSGLQSAGFFNINRNDLSGAQMAGFMNISGTTDAQFAGFLNIADDVPYTQIGGFCNIAKDATTQLAGFINKSDDATVQLAGFINIAKDAKVQMAGFMNIADSCDYPIGLINIMKKGEKTIGLSIDESQTVLASFRSGGRIMYGIVGVGYNLSMADLMYGFEAGIGAHLPVSKMFRINFEAAGTGLVNFTGDGNYKFAVRALPAVTLGGKWELFAGPTVSFLNMNLYTNDPFEGYSFWSSNNWGRDYSLSLGAIAGIQLHL